MRWVSPSNRERREALNDDVLCREDLEFDEDGKVAERKEEEE